MPKRTNQPKKLPKLRSLGFRARNATPAGRRVLKRRRAKGRAKLSVSEEFGTSKRKMISRAK